MSACCQLERPAYEHKVILDFLQDTFLRTVDNLRRRSPWQSCLEEGPVKSEAVWKHLTAEEKAEIEQICDEKLDGYYAHLKEKKKK